MNAESLNIGKLIEGGVPNRDAIHVAIAPVVAGVELSPGQHVGFDADGHATPNAKPIGIVDQFLTCNVKPRQACWLFLYPGSITSLRHDWTHPAFGVTTKSHEAHVADSMKWLREHAAFLGMRYQELMDAADRMLLGGEYTVQRDSQWWRDEFGDPREFWHHYEIVTGKYVENKEQTFFCCTC